MDYENLKQRTKLFALAIIELVEKLPNKGITQIIGRQLLKSGTSVGANYRSACRAKSAADFISKMGIVEEEIDESLYWLELLIEREIIKESEIGPLIKETKELLAITISSIKTARKNKAAKSRKI